MMTRTRSAGFSLIELLISVAILGLLAGGAMAFADLAVQRQNEQVLRANLREIRQAIDAYKQAWDAGRIAHVVGDTGYPHALSDLSGGVVDVTSAKGSRLYFLRRLPRDPMADAALPAEATWGLRSYESSPDDPHSGRDVFDVHSLSPRKGLNGQPYESW